MPALATNPTSLPHKHRVSRRRGRVNGFHTDEDDIVREARSDSDTDQDDQSSADSESDSETEPVSEDVPQDAHPQLLSPGTTPPVINDSKDDPNHAPLIAASVTWSEMVADQVANGSADLPVIDFADLDDSPIHSKPPRAPVPRKLHKSKRGPANRRSSPPPVSSPLPSEPTVPPISPSPPSSRVEPHPVSAPAPHRRGQTARQAYQERLENDPSYVPTVGEFWGHDDRLLDKDLRSLSGWWRGRWQGGPRGRGFPVRGRGRERGRGSANPTPDSHSNHDSPSPSQPDVPPVDRQWTHDGFEELKRREEQRSQRRGHSQGSNGNPRPPRGNFTPRGRPFARGRFSPRPASVPSTDSPTSMSSRTWFLIKPERPWTKHHELFLYSDPSQRPRSGQGPAYRVKLSGTSLEAIVQSPTQHPPPRVPTPPRDAAHDDGELVFVVSLPRGQCKPEVAESTLTPAAVLSPEQATDAPIVEVPSASTSPAVPTTVVEPESPPKLHVAIEEQPVVASEPPADDPFKLRDPPPPTVIPLPTNTPTQVNSAAGAPEATASPSGPAHISHSATAPEGGLLWRSPPPHLQTAFAQSAPAPGYASPYPYAPVSAPTVPPGVALDAHGMPYELATGRPLYLAAPPQVPTPVYMLPYPHLPSHMQHRPHASPDPSLFAPPRQSSRIEIRRPDAPFEESPLSSAHAQTHVSRSSTLRASTSAPAFIPSHAPGHQPPPAPHEFYPSPPPEVPSAPAMMGYAAYPQPPYYPYGAAEGYTYPPPQFVEYDAYSTDPRGAAPAATQAVYY
jgi:CASC3/Barentsz eIF4AIII binding